MIPAEFDYAAPASVEEAVRLLAQRPGAKLLAGGMSLIPAMKHRLAQPTLVVDVGRLAELEGVEARRGGVRIGAGTRHAALLARSGPEGREGPEASEAPEALAELALVAEAAAVIGDVQVRNRGTFGGSLVHADPAGDWPAVFLALDGEAVLVGPKGRRTVAARDFFVSMLTSAAAEDEVLTEVTLPVRGDGGKRAGTAYRKLRQPASGFAVVGVAARVALDRKGRIEEAALGVTGVNPVPFRAAGVEARLRGAAADDFAALRAACRDVDEADPMDDIHASADYRRHLVGVFAARAVAAAAERAAR